MAELTIPREVWKALNDKVCDLNDRNALLNKVVEGLEQVITREGNEITKLEVDLSHALARYDILHQRPASGIQFDVVQTAIRSAVQHHPAFADADNLAAVQEALGASPAAGSADDIAVDWNLFCDEEIGGADEEIGVAATAGGGGAGGGAPPAPPPPAPAATADGGGVGGGVPPPPPPPSKGPASRAVPLVTQPAKPKGPQSAPPVDGMQLLKETLAAREVAKQAGAPNAAELFDEKKREEVEQAEAAAAQANDLAKTKAMTNMSGYRQAQRQDAGKPQRALQAEKRNDGEMKDAVMNGLKGHGAARTGSVEDDFSDTEDERSECGEQPGHVNDLCEEPGQAGNEQSYATPAHAFNGTSIGFGSIPRIPAAPAARGLRTYSMVPAAPAATLGYCVCAVFPLHASCGGRQPRI